MFDAIRYGADISSRPIQTVDFKTQPKKTTKKTTMNEILDSLEAMIRRIVAEEVAKLPDTPPVVPYSAIRPLDFISSLKEAANLYPSDFEQTLKPAILDKGWFDDAITAQAVAAGDVSSQTDFETKFKRMADGTNIVSRVVHDVVESNWFTEHMQNTLIDSDALDDRITKVVSNMSIVA